MDILEIDGSVTPEQAKRLEENIWQHLPGVSRIDSSQFGKYAYTGEVRHSDPLALAQMLLTYHVLRQSQAGRQRLLARPVAA